MKVIDSLGRTLRFEYDAQARVIKVTDQSGAAVLCMRMTRQATSRR